MTWSAGFTSANEILTVEFPANIINRDFDLSTSSAIGAIPAFTEVEDENDDEDEQDLDFGEAKCQQHVKRAVEVAGAGGHNILTFGPMPFASE